MKRSFLLAASLAVGSAIIALPALADEPVRVQGVAALTRVFKAAAPQLQEVGIEIKVGEECGNSQALAALGNDEIDIALLGRPLTAEDRAAIPERALEEQKLGAQAVVFLVSRPIWESGVRALSREQITEIYEGHARSWKQFGGEDRSVKFFEPAHGHGIWEIFANWLYGDVRKAPAVSWETVATGAEAQNAVQFYTGAASVAALRWADRREVFPIAIKDAGGEPIDPTPENVTSGKYPLTRAAYLVVGGKPVGNKRKVMEFFRGEKGQAVVAASDLVPMVHLSPP